MAWIKKAQIFTANGEHDKMHSHAQIPAPLKIGDNEYRIYFSSRDMTGKARPYYLEYDFAADKITKLETTPLFEHGDPGTFDDSGIMPASAVRVGDEIYLYYIAWNGRTSVPYHLSIGLAISKDNGVTFEKYAQGPVMDRAVDEPFFNTAPCVVFENGEFRMWYISCTQWKEINGRLEPVYLVRHAWSENGIHWQRDQDLTIKGEFDGEAIGRPWVIHENGIYKMWYSRRGSIDYRLPSGQHYTIGYAESQDGENWTRKDNLAGIEKSTSGWDSEMIEYCSVVDVKDHRIMLYNGNMFGLTGFGYAEEKQ